jgi:recombinational DNA repair protein RecR
MPFNEATMNDKEKDAILRRLLNEKSMEEILGLMANLDEEDKAWLMQELLKTTGFERNGNAN